MLGAKPQHPLKLRLLAAGLRRQQVLLAADLLQASSPQLGLLLRSPGCQLPLFPPPCPVQALLVPASAVLVLRPHGHAGTRRWGERRRPASPAPPCGLWLAPAGPSAC